jgi:hypothetical protein
MRLGRHWAITGLAIAVSIAVPRDAAAFWDWIHELSGPSMIGVGYTCKPFEPRPFRGEPSIDYVLMADVPHGLRVGASLQVEGAVKVTAASVVAVGPEPDSKTFTVRVNAPLPSRITLKSPDNRSLQVTAVALSHDQCFSRMGYSPRPSPDDRFHYWVRLEGYYRRSVKHADNPERRWGVHAVTAGAMFEWSPAHPGAHDTTVAFFGAGVEQFRFVGKNFKPVDRLAIKLRPVAVRINKRPIKQFKALEYGVDVRYFLKEFVPQDFGVVGKDRTRDGGEWTLGFFFSAVLR